MAYDVELAQRIRDIIGNHPALEEKKMFGGIAFLIGGNMSVGVHGEELMARVSPEDDDALLARPGARPMDFTGRPMKGWLTIEPTGLSTDEALTGWVDISVAFAESLPVKTAADKAKQRASMKNKTTP